MGRQGKSEATRKNFGYPRRTPFTSESALFKLFYCSCQRIKEKWNMPIHNWALIISQLDIYFPGRLRIELSSDLGADTLR